MLITLTADDLGIHIFEIEIPYHVICGEVVCSVQAMQLVSTALGIIS
jgi:hypothetical protein